MKSLLVLVAIILNGAAVFAADVNRPCGPSATEVFDLRGRCAKIAAQMADDAQQIDMATKRPVGVTGKSRYDIQANRCYVELDYNGSRDNRFDASRQLFDGQTKDLLAFASYKAPADGWLFWGAIYDARNWSGFTEGYDKNAAHKFIDTVMKETDR